MERRRERKFETIAYMWRWEKKKLETRR